MGPLVVAAVLFFLGVRPWVATAECRAWKSLVWMDETNDNSRTQLAAACCLPVLP